MASPPAWSIGAGKRNAGWSSSGAVPGPGSYNSRSNAKLQAPSWSMGTSIRGADAIEKTPGPGTYSTPGKLNTTSPSYTLGTKVGQEIVNFTPGPGTYDANRLRGNQTKAPSFSIRAKSQVGEDKEKVPGPGTYNQTSKIHQNSSPNYRIGSALRKPLNGDSDTPGPGAYSNRKNSFSRDGGPKYRFGTSDRNEINTSVRDLPGPGAYISKSQFGNGAKGFSLVPRREENELLGPGSIPGPGAYNASFKNKNSQPAYKIGGASRDNLAGGPIDTPGPGNYTLRDIHNTPNWKIGTSLRQPLNSVKNVPGPGSYSQKTNVGEGPKYHMNPRRDDVTKSQNDRAIPGPGAYNPNVSATKFKSSAAGIGGSERSDLYGSRTNPGPGQYDIRGGLKGPKWGFGHERRDHDVTSATPGPGYYKLPPKIGDVASYAYKSYPLKIHM